VYLSAVANHLTYVQAIILGVLQGVTELFPVSSLGHSVILPQIFGWTGIVDAQSSQSTSNFLTFLVGLHVGTALALIVFYWRDWGRIIAGLWSSTKARKVSTSAEHLAWLIVVGSVPVGIAGLVLEKHLRSLFAKPTWAAAFLILNGIVLFIGERVRTSQTARHSRGSRRGVTLKSLSYRDGFIVGASQIFALFAGFSRSGVSIVAGLFRGLHHDDAAKLSFLLATPIILAAGLYKLPTLFTSSGREILGQVVVGAIASAIAAYFSVRFLSKWFTTKTLLPFAIYCVGAGAIFMALVI